MKWDKFPPGVTKHLKWYVYRLIDPRNGKTFYVGKGQGNRVFQHAKFKLKATKKETKADLKFSQMKEIERAGLEVGYVLHRHHIETEKVAFQIEAALIDAYPNLTNKVKGHGSDEYGSKPVRKIIAKYGAKPFKAREPLILISIARNYEEGIESVYKAVRGVWRINIKTARTYKLVLAHRHGIVEGAFRPKKWLPAKKAYFPWIKKNEPKRCGFTGVKAEPSVAALYLDMKVPDKFRPKGAANPVRLVKPGR